MTFPFGDQVTILRRTAAGTDAYGNTVLTAVPQTVIGAFDPGGSTELVQGQDMVVSQPTVYLPAGTVVGATDALVVAGVTYEVDGAPRPWRSPFTGVPFGVAVKVKAVTG